MREIKPLNFYDIYGKKINLQMIGNQLDVSSLLHGMYVMEIIFEDGSRSFEKFMVK